MIMSPFYLLRGEGFTGSGATCADLMIGHDYPEINMAARSWTERVNMEWGSLEIVTPGSYPSIE
jgi:hypothetical protein